MVRFYCLTFYLKKYFQVLDYLDRLTFTALSECGENFSQNSGVKYKWMHPLDFLVSEAEHKSNQQSAGRWAILLPV